MPHLGRCRLLLRLRLRLLLRTQQLLSWTNTVLNHRLGLTAAVKTHMPKHHVQIAVE